jgi:hypothetical protein
MEMLIVRMHRMKIPTFASRRIVPVTSFNAQHQDNVYQKTGNVMDRKTAAMEKMSLTVVPRLVLLRNSNAILVVSCYAGNVMVIWIAWMALMNTIVLR